MVRRQSIMTTTATAAGSTASAHVIHVLHGETMGTTWCVKLAATPRADLHALHAGIQSQLDLVVAQMSTWEADSDISRFNRSAPGTCQELPAAFATVLSCALEIARASDGAYDPTVGPLVEAWGFGASSRTRQVPDAGLLSAARARTGWQRVALHSDPARVLQTGQIQLDLSGIAKGHGVDRVVDHLRGHGIGSALVEVGGELHGYGRKPDGSHWQVLVEAAPDEDAGDDAGTPCVIAVDGFAIATSGDHWHAFEHAGTRYAHTLDPRTGKPVEHAPAAVTVIAGSAMQADAWATALTVMGTDAGFDFAQAHGLSARFVARGDDGRVERMTDAFHARLHA